MKKNFQVHLAILAALLAVSGCGKGQHEQTGPVPESWHTLPENAQPAQAPAAAQPSASVPTQTEAPTVALTEMTDRILSTTQSSLESAEIQDEDAAISPESFGAKPKNWVPWHAEYFMTDLAVSLQGLIAPLVYKGTPAVSLIWRKKHEAKKPLVAPEALESGADLVLDELSTPASIETQIEPAIQAMLARHPVKDEKGMRKRLVELAQNLVTMGQDAAANPGTAWWVSRIRLDLAVEASGKVLVVPTTYTVGAEAKLRFEWHRLKNRGTHLEGAGKPASNPRLRDFLTALAQDLEQVSDEQTRLEGLKAYTFRVGVGVTPKGDVGVIKEFTPNTVSLSGTLLAQLYFSRDVAKPSADPRLAEMSRLTAIPVIEGDESHEQFARDREISFETSKTGPVVYQVERPRFRKGLDKAMKMAAFFAKRAHGTKPGKWGIYEMRTALDLSLSGDVGLVNVAGLATLEINFYNESF